MRQIKRTLAAFAVTLAATAANAAPALMSPGWAKEMCAAWNADPTLTTKLVESGWIKNDKGRGYKVMQIYRSDCPGSPRVELKVVPRDGKVLCTYGGKAEAKLDDSADYLMWSTTEYWGEMGKGQYGPMRAMMFGRLRFDGPYGEAMSNMGPFESFLLLVGKVPGDTASCPAK
jgi:putative sterol carrier protein